MPLSPFLLAGRFQRTGHTLALTCSIGGLALALLPLIARGLQ